MSEHVAGVFQSLNWYGEEVDGVDEEVGQQGNEPSRLWDSSEIIKFKVQILNDHAKGKWSLSLLLE